MQLINIMIVMALVIIQIRGQIIHTCFIRIHTCTLFILVCSVVMGFCLTIIRLIIGRYFHNLICQFTNEVSFFRVALCTLKFVSYRWV